MKDSYYFPHDTDAHRDPKCSALLSEFGSSGYGTYWMIIEVLHQQGGKLRKFPKLFDGLSHQLQLPKESLEKQIEAMIKDYHLFQEDDEYIWSDRVIRNLQEREAKRVLRLESSRVGGIKSGESRKMKQTEVN